MTAMLIGVLAGAIVSTASILYATLGEVIGERAGIVNLGVEGQMLVGASIGFVIAAITKNALFGVAVAAVAGAAFNMVFGYLVVTRRTNQLASGIAMWFLGLGLSTLIGSQFVGRHILGLEAIELPGLSALPPVYAQLFSQDVLVYLMVPVAILIWWLLFHTRWGLHLRAVGEDATTAIAAGLRPSVLQYQALMLAGALGAVGGAQLSLAYTKTWQEGMTAGRGFLAVVIVIFALWHPLRAILGAFLFGAAVALGLALQAGGAPTSPFLLDMLPYLVTLTVALLGARARAFTVPMGLRAVFEGTAG
jgi:general nucleoside transport system permease protein